MKSQNKSNNIQFNSNKPSPEVRDNLDSRKNEEWIVKGDDVTHTKKNHSNKHPKKHK